MRGARLVTATLAERLQLRKVHLLTTLVDGQEARL